MDYGICSVRFQTTKIVIFFELCKFFSAGNAEDGGADADILLLTEGGRGRLSIQEQAAVAVTEKTESVVECETVALAPAVADEGGDQQ